MKYLTIFFLFIYSFSLSQAKEAKKVYNDSNYRTIKPTPFNPKGTYQTFAFRLRLLPWNIGDNKGYNTLAGIQLGFLRNHSLSVDIMKGYSNMNLDAYYKNDTLILPNRTRIESTLEIHFAYNYHLEFESLRRNTGLSFYAGLNYRIGKLQLTSDTGMYVGDHTLKSKRQYYSIGPQVGAIWNIGESKLFALNINVTPYYSIKNIETTEVRGTNYSTHSSKFKTVDFRLGFNFIIWIKYHKRTVCWP
jgi:hypothetical protein